MNIVHYKGIFIKHFLFFPHSISYLFRSIFSFKVVKSISCSLVESLNKRNYVFQNILTNLAFDFLGPTIFQLISSVSFYFLNQWGSIVNIQLIQSVFMKFIYHKLLNFVIFCLIFCFNDKFIFLIRNIIIIALKS